MNDSTKQKILNVAKYIKETHSTLRDTAEHFGISKSTIHRDIKHRLMDIDFQMYKDIIDIISENKMKRSIRGGTQTKLKYSKNKIKGEDEKMELTLRQEKVMKAVKQLKNEGKATCIRQDIMRKLGITKHYSGAGYANIFKELEDMNQLVKVTDKGTIIYVLKDKNFNDIELFNLNIGQCVRLQDILKIANIDKQYSYKFTCKINKMNKTTRNSVDSFLYLNIEGVEEFVKYLQEDGNITKNQEKILLQIVDYMKNEIELIENQEDTYEDLQDLDEIFDSLLKTVDTINIRVNTFKAVREDKDAKIRMLESDKMFYKNKCDEYRKNIIRLQEKIDALRWG